ncbi:MAG: DNA-directed RNA polymerase subunit alpha C-terminal domain-containing protein [Planctomycetota bacterium]|jgi:DNA-directed RNA polymerase subunit alpha
MTSSTTLPLHAGDPAKAKQHLDRAQQCEKVGDRDSAIEAYRQALAEHHAVDTVFALARLLDRVGEDEEAVELYERICFGQKPPVNALINLAILYEDMNELTRAERCLRRIVDEYPTHPHARMYLKDVMGVMEMTIDSDAQQQLVRKIAIENTPITDFELSGRARNCLKKVEIKTLGDLLRHTEAELLAFKNFGESSISEIKAMLAARGLRLGQALEGGQDQAFRREYLDYLKTQHDEAALSISVATMELSVRAKKAISLLEARTLGELACRTEAELMGLKNFGLTSLDEIKAQLAIHGLSLRPLE